MGEGQPPTAPALPTGAAIRPAGFRIRAVALLIDGVILSPLALAPIYAFYAAANPRWPQSQCDPDSPGSPIRRTGSG